MIWIRRGIALSALVLILVMLLAWWWLRASLPTLDGVQQVTGIDAPVSLVRDAQGLLTVQADDREDIAFGLGFAHAQDRFTQMDLQRRRAAGELSEMFGSRAVAVDSSARIHRFRARARKNLARNDAATRALLDAYANGVNAGLESLSKPPFEYTLLGVTPQPWAPEDTYLTLYSMMLLLQDSDGSRERALGFMQDLLPPQVFDFLIQPGGRWDAPLEGPAFIEQAVPDIGINKNLPETTVGSALVLTGEDELPGSNNWALDGRFTPHESALVANDMHLPVGIPNTWYRAGWIDPSNGWLISGATLPGTPFMIVGSNTRIAWGFTNAQGDWSDVVVLELDESGKRYRTPEGWEPFARYPENINVKDGQAVILDVLDTRYGPVIGKDHLDRTLALRWTAHDEEVANANLMQLEQATQVQDVLRMAHQFGMPQENLVVGDSEGNIAWVIAGPVPKRFGDAGRFPITWHDGQSGWSGYHGNATQPQLTNPEHGRLWTANARVVSGEAYDIMGDDGAALGARQQQIRDRLFALDAATPAEMLAIQRDDEASFLARWQHRLVLLLEQLPAEDDPAISAALTQVRNWSGHARKEDIGYRLVRAWRLAVLERVFAPVNDMLRQHGQEFSLTQATRQLEYPGWQLLEERPAHWLNPAFSDWEALELDAIKSVLDPLFEDETLANDSWGEINRLDIRHPMANSIPVFGSWLTLPAVAMDGDTHMPFVQRPGFSASQRFAVSPGHEADGYFHMPGGQSGHPLSPFFDLGHDDWVEGKTSPWLAGAPAHKLLLEPPP